MILTSPLVFHETKVLEENEVKQLFDLWNNEYPAYFNYPTLEDFNTYLNHLKDVRHYLMKNEEDAVLAWAADFEREKERWFGIIVSSEQQQQGLGSLLMKRLKSQNKRLCGWMVDHDRELRKDNQPYLSPAPFYRRQGFTFHPSEHLGFDRISAIKITWPE